MPFLSFKKLPQNVILLGIVSFLNDVSSDMVYPLLPIFLTDVLGASRVFVGLVEGLADSASSLLKLVSGWASDKMGKRKIFVTSGYFLSAASKPFLALVTNFWQVFAIRLFDRTGKGIRTSPRDAMIADFTGENLRGLSFGFHRALDSAGAIFGPLLAVLIFPLLNQNYRNLFLIASFPAILSLLVLIFRVKERKDLVKAQVEKQKISRTSLNRNFYLFLLAILIFSLGKSSDAFLFLRAKSLGISLTLIPLLWVLFNIVYTLFSYPAGGLSDKIGRKKILLSGLLVYAVTYSGFGFTKTALSVWILFAVYGLFYGLTEGVFRAFVADLVPQEKRGLAYGFYHTTVGITTLPASLIFGFFWDKFGAAFAFSWGAILALVSGIMLTFVKTDYKKLEVS